MEWLQGVHYLVFSGGGSRGLSFVGALVELEKRGLSFRQLKGVAGTSIGALIAVLVACGYSTAELTEVVCATDMSQLFSLNLGLLVTKFGMDDGTRLRAYIEQLLVKKLGKARMTLAEFRLQTGVDVVVVATDLNTNSAVYLRADTHPILQVSEAVATSMAIPPVFAPRQLDGATLVDGGFTDNFPMHLFPAVETLGMRAHWNCAFKLNSVDQYFSRVAYCALSISENAQWEQLSALHKKRVVNIDTGDIQTVDLRLTEEEKLNIVHTGIAAVEKFCCR